VKRFGRSQHYLHSQAQSEQAGAFKTLCRAAACASWLVIGRWGALLGELCSLPVSLVYLDVCPSYTRIPYTPRGPHSPAPGT